MRLLTRLYGMFTGILYLTLKRKAHPLIDLRGRMLEKQVIFFCSALKHICTALKHICTAWLV